MNGCLACQLTISAIVISYIVKNKRCTLEHLSSSMASSRRRQWHPTPVLLPGKSHGRRSLVGCNPWGRWVGHDWTTSLSLFTFMHWRRKWQPTPVFLPGESQGRGEPGGLPSMGSHRVGHDWSDSAAAAAAWPVLLSKPKIYFLLPICK